MKSPQFNDAAPLAGRAGVNGPSDAPNSTRLSTTTPARRTAAADLIAGPEAAWVATASATAPPTGRGIGT